MIERDSMRRRTAISRLLLLCRPSAIVRCVVTAVVDAIQRMQSTWASSHVRKETRKIVVPFRAYLYAPSAVARVIVGVFIVAAVFHLAPRLIFRSLGKTVGGQHLLGDAPARSYISHAKIAANYGFLVSAIASAQPQGRFTRSALISAVSTDNRETTEAKATHVDGWTACRHNAVV